MKTYQVTVSKDKTEWKFNGKLHREDGPAVEWVNGDKSWYINGKWANGDKEWFINGKLHREDGPAVELANGNKYWYINDKRMTEEEFNRRKVKEFSMEELEKVLGYKVKIVKK
jgi:hypothetical protein